MSLFPKSLYLLWILLTINSFIIFKNGSLIYKGNKNIAFCFKCSNINKVNLNKNVNYPKFKNCSLSYSISPPVCDTFKVDSDYLSLLNKKLAIFQKLLVDQKISECYNELKDLLNGISFVISEYFSPPLELDYNSKLEEIRSKFGQNVDRIEAYHLLKSDLLNINNKYELSFEFLTQEKDSEGKVSSRLWTRKLTPIYYRGLQKQLSCLFKEFSNSLGHFFVKFHTENFPLDQLFQTATTLGLQATQNLFEGISLLQLNENFHINYDLDYKLDKSFEIVDYFYNFDFLGNRFYSKLVNHFFVLEDPKSILLIIKKFSRYPGKKVNALYLTQFLLTVSNEIEHLNSQTSKSSDAIEDKKTQYFKLKEMVKEALELYQEKYLHTFNLTHELGEIIERKFRDLVPGFIKISRVSQHPKLLYGTCESCGYRINFKDVSEEERLKILSKMMKTIYESSPKEIPPLMKFYTFLLNAFRYGNRFTCVIDGQNLGYYHNSTGQLNWPRIYYAYSFMKSMGENPLIVLPQNCTNKLKNYLMRADVDGYRSLIGLIEEKKVYMTNRYSYDDNYFLLAGIVRFSKQEFELLQQYDNSIDLINAVNTLDKAEKDKNVIILTNDRLSNLSIDDVNEEILDHWKLYSLINFSVIYSQGRETLILGQRLKFTFSPLFDGDKVHIPLGYDRIFTNCNEILKCKLQLSYLNYSPKLQFNIDSNVETQISKWIKSHNLNLLNDNAEVRKGYRERNSSEVYHKCPEIVKEMFTPFDKSQWLCIDVGAFDSLINNF